MYRSEIE